MPNSVYESLQVPSLAKVELRKISQFFTYELTRSADLQSLQVEPASFERLNHLQMQLDHLEGTEFVQTTLLVDTSGLAAEQKPYLELLTNLLFELPLRDEASGLEMSHEQAVYEVNKDLLEFGSSIGINGSQMEPGIYAEYLTVFAKVQVKDYELAIKWTKNVLFASVFDRKQVGVALANLLKEISKRKTQPNDIIHSLSNDINFKASK